MEFRDKRIERNVGDKNGRTPHFNIVGSGGVLYVPDGKSWGMRYFKTPEDAVDFLDAKFGIMGLEQTEAADKQEKISIAIDETKDIDWGALEQAEASDRAARAEYLMEDR